MGIYWLSLTLLIFPIILIARWIRAKWFPNYMLVYTIIVVIQLTVGLLSLHYDGGASGQSITIFYLGWLGVLAGYETSSSTQTPYVRYELALKFSSGTKRFLSLIVLTYIVWRIIQSPDYNSYDQYIAETSQTLSRISVVEYLSDGILTKLYYLLIFTLLSPYLYLLDISLTSIHTLVHYGIRAGALFAVIMCIAILNRKSNFFRRWKLWICLLMLIPVLIILAGSIMRAPFNGEIIEKIQILFSASAVNQELGYLFVNSPEVRVFQYIQFIIDSVAESGTRLGADYYRVVTNQVGLTDNIPAYSTWLSHESDGIDSSSLYGTSSGEAYLNFGIFYLVPLFVTGCLIARYERLLEQFPNSLSLALYCMSYKPIIFHLYRGQFTDLFIWFGTTFLCVFLYGILVLRKC
jgi:hypothetical protein